MVTPLSEEHKVLYLDSMFFGVGQFRDRSYWRAERTFGLVDWVEASIGPAWLDVAHCCTNIAMVHGNEVADLFAAAYIERTGREAQPYFDVMDVVGFLHPPGKSGFFSEDGKENRRLEQRLRAVMVRMRG